MTMKLVQTIAVTSTPFSVTFNNIPQNATDLLLLISQRSEDSFVSTFSIIFNGDSGSNYSGRRLFGTGAGTNSLSFANQNTLIIGYYAGGTAATSNTFGNTAVYIPNYTSNVAKSLSADSVYENNASTAYQSIASGFWNNTAAITSISMDSPLVVGCSVSLYTITKA